MKNKQRTPCCHKVGLKKGAWTPEEDKLLVQYINQHGPCNWRTLPKFAGLSRCGKSCRLRWTNYLRPDIKRGPFSLEEEACIIRLQAILGNRWASIASHMPGRTDNEVKNFWNIHLKKRFLSNGNLLQTSPLSSIGGPKTVKSESASTLHAVQWESIKLETEARLMMNSSLTQCSSSTDNTYCDIYLNLWNSDVGQRFRNTTKPVKKEKQSESSMSDTSSWIRLEENSYTTCEEKPTISGSDATYGQVDRSKPSLDMMIVSSDTISSNEFSHSSDAALKQLLDLPTTNNGLGVLQDQTDDYLKYLNLQYQ